MHLTIVGGSGFIGKHFVNAALQRGHAITMVGRQERAPAGCEHVDYRPGGLRALSSDTGLLSSTHLICHFATTTNPSSSNRDPDADIQQNLRETVHLLEAMRLAGNRRILFLSSGGAVYGQPRYLPIDEVHPLNPISSYGVIKVAIENYIRLYEANHDFRATIIRPSNPYGPGQDASGQLGVIARFVSAALKEEEVTIWGDGSVVRDYIYVSDLVALLLTAAEAERPGTYNCGSGVGTSLIDLVALVEQATGRPFARRSEPARVFDPRKVILDASLAKRMFDWTPQIDLAVGLQLTI